MHGDEILELLLERCDLFYFLKLKMDLLYKKHAVMRLAHHPLCASYVLYMHLSHSLAKDWIAAGIFMHHKKAHLHNPLVKTRLSNK
jgi:hypothetical protein